MTTGAKMRVYEIAREVGIPNKDLLAKIRAMGLEVNNHMSSLDADDVDKIKRTLAKERGGAAPAAAEPKAGTAAPVVRRKAAAKDEAPAAPTPPPVQAVPPVVRRRAHVEGDA